MAIAVLAHKNVRRNAKGRIFTKFNTELRSNVRKSFRSFWSSPRLSSSFSLGNFGHTMLTQLLMLTDGQTENTVCVGLEINGFITTMLQSDSSDRYRSPRHAGRNWLQQRVVESKAGNRIFRENRSSYARMYNARGSGFLDTVVCDHLSKLRSSSSTP